MKEKLSLWVERFLMADIFLVMISFAWFVVALIGRYLGIPLGWDVWYSLWIPVFNPAIGILFTGIIFSWLIKKVGLMINKEG